MLTYIITHRRLNIYAFCCFRSPYCTTLYFSLCNWVHPEQRVST